LIVDQRALELVSVGVAVDLGLDSKPRGLIAYPKLDNQVRGTL